MPPGPKTLRLAVGTPEKPRSSAWRFWVHRNEVYVAARSTASVIKLSLHSSGVWPLAFTEHSGNIFEHTESRRSHTFHRPPSFQPGWTWGPVISIPRVDSKHGFAPVPNVADVQWRPAPPIGHAKFFSLLFAADLKADPFAVLDDDPSGEVAGFLDLENGERCWVLEGLRRLTKAEKRPVLEIREETKIEVTPLDRKDPPRSSIFWHTHIEGRPWIVEIVLGQLNYYDGSVVRGR